MDLIHQAPSHLYPVHRAVPLMIFESIFLADDGESQMQKLSSRPIMPSPNTLREELSFLVLYFY
jgi:hypothetical protein